MKSSVLFRRAVAGRAGRSAPLAEVMAKLVRGLRKHWLHTVMHCLFQK